LNDPQSLHKYLYTFSDPINYTDPTGNIPFLIFPLLGAIIGTAIGAGVGYYFGGSEGAFYGGIGGFSMGLGAGYFVGLYALPLAAATAAVAMWETPMEILMFGGLLTMLGGWAWGGGTMSWGVKKVGSSPNITQKRVAIVYGDLGPMYFGFLAGLISLKQFSELVNSAGHTAEIIAYPSEDKFIQICNSGDYDAVLIVAHGLGRYQAGEYVDKNGQKFAGFKLGGKTLLDIEKTLDFEGGGTLDIGETWITANELKGKITNHNLQIFAASCRALQNDSMKNTLNVTGYYGYKKDISAGEVVVIMRGLVRYLNGENDLQLSNLD
jgi:hypothetical protein